MTAQQPRPEVGRSTFTWRVVLDLAASEHRVVFWRTEGLLPEDAAITHGEGGRTVITWSNVADSKPEAEVEMLAVFKGLPTPRSRDLVERTPVAAPD